MRTTTDLVLELDAAFNARQLQRLEELVTSDVVVVSPRGVADGPDGFRALLAQGLAMFPDLAVTPLAVVDRGDVVAVEQRITAGSLATCELVVAESRDARITSWRAYYDQLPVAIAAGMAPPQALPDPCAHPGPAGEPGADADELARRFLALIDSGTTDFSGALRDDGVFVHPSAAVIGSTQLAALMAPFRVAFPDARHTIARVLAADGSAVVEGTWDGTHTGPLTTPNGELPASGTAVSVPFAALARVAGDRIATVHLYTDQVAFATQLGMMPASA